MCRIQSRRLDGPVTRIPTARSICLHKPSRGGVGLPRQPTSTRALPLQDAPTAATAAAAAILGLPATVLLDELLDTISPRVNAITNVESNGVRMFVARPSQPGPPSSGGGTATPTARLSGASPAGSASTSPAGRRPAVILIHQILGLQKRETELAQALAEEEGAVVVAPDTFRGQSTLWPFRAIALGFKYALRTGASWGVESVHEAVTWLKSQPDVDPDRIVVAGFCYGGGSAVRYAAAHPGEVAGVAIFYGRPLLQASEVAKLGSTPVLGMYGTRDSQFPPAMLERFKADLAAAGVPHRLELFEGEGHAFLRDLAAVRQGGAAGRSWQLFREFVRQVARGQFQGSGATRERADVQ
ncbi:hypothetical protein PLESTB_000459800 [Pleodorina starrii]|uniref:Dienelactone hydrolase domain-containing protein n=1 Tax=Pleodorina starrii TaxID=330485 RepID=A0A9W6EZR4_9CHLO|nr:hypothetical protein PLESTM_000794100 [Pleodorina starrii]GLC51042.1 hypothetical protein PLESTB_000459800 [Pleodorina starrii]GLC63402.1 hypothetical protein PLESTF_000032500 [Pleodorina starrii]